MTSVSLVQATSDLADQAVILPLVSAVLAVLLLMGEWRAAKCWSAAIGTALGTTLVAKLVFIPCGALIPAINLRSPSGHTASVAAAYGGLMMLLARVRALPGGRATAFLATAAAIVLVAVTRILLHAHTVEETIAGAAIGFTAPLLLAIPRNLFVGSRVLQHWWAMVLPLLIVPVMLGHRAHTERWIRGVAIAAAHLMRACGA